MDIAKNMEFIFFGAVTLSCGLVFFKTTPPTIIVNVSSPSVKPQSAQSMIVKTNRPEALPRMTAAVTTPVTATTPATSTVTVTSGTLPLTQR